MPAATPAWTLVKPHGQVAGVQVRAAQALLALGQVRQVSCPVASDGGAWLQLFTLGEQLQLYMAGQGPKGVQSADLSEIRLAAPGSMGAGLGAGQWLGLMQPPAVNMPTPRGGTRVWVLGAGTTASMRAGPPARGPWLLPHALDEAFLAAVPDLGGENSGFLWIAQDASPNFSLPRLLALAHKQPGPIVAFDATGVLDTPHVKAQLPAHVTVHGPTDAAGRRALFLTCRTYVVDEAIGDGDGLWALEAQALGLVPHGVAAPKPAPDTTSWADLWSALLPVMESAGGGQDDAAARSERGGLVTLARGRTLEVTTDAGLLPPADADLGPRPRGLLLWGNLPAAAAWPQVAQDILGGAYAVVFNQVGPHSQFLTTLMMAALMRPGVQAPTYQHQQDPEDLWLLACQWLWDAGDGAHLTVLVVGGAGPHLDGAHQRVADLMQLGEATSWARPEALPVLAIHGVDNIFRTGAPSARVGAQVAGADIGSGVAAAAAGRFAPRWLESRRNSAGGKAQFMHPLTCEALAQGPVHEARIWSSTTLRIAFERDRVDGVFVPRGPLGAALQMLRAQHAVRPVPLVHVLHGVHHTALVPDFLSYMMHGPVYPCDAFIAPSRAAKRAFEQLWRHVAQNLSARGVDNVPGDVDVPVIPYGVDTGYFAGYDKLACRLNLGLPAHGFVVLSLCRLVRRYKACLMPLLLAAQAMRHAGVQVHLVIAGEAQDPAEVPRLKEAADALGLGAFVTFVQNVSLADKAQLLAACDVYVALSDNMQESHGIAPIEAMAAGAPVVAAAWDGFRELVVEGETGHLIPTRWTDIPADRVADNAHDKQLHEPGFDDLHETVATDVGALTQALIGLAQNPDRGRALGAAGQRLAQSRFDAKVQGEVMACLLQEKIRHGRALAATWVRPTRYLPPDPLTARFGHYPSDWVDENTEVACGPRAQEPAQVAAIMAYIDPDDAFEAIGVRETLAALGSRSAPLRTLIGPRMDMLRLMRCLKYDILRVVGPQ